MLLPENVRLRPICESDIALLRSVYASARESELTRVDWTAAQKSAFLISQFELQHRYYQEHFPRGEFNVVEYRCDDDFRAIGRLYLDRHGCDLRLIDIALLPEWRNRGIGSAILRGLLSLSDQLGKEIVLHVETTNPAVSLYSRLGFAARASNDVYFRLSRLPQTLVA